MLFLIFYFFAQFGSLKSFFQAVNVVFSKTDLLEKSVFHQDPKSQWNAV